MSADQVHSWIDQQVKSNDVVLFMKGSKSFPQCGFSGRVAQILNYLGVNFKDVDVLEDMSIREGVKTYTNWPTIPQLYVKGEFIGGADIVTEMFQSGELEQVLSEKGVAVSKATA
jgi:monothiol glutaredoxin